MSDIDPSALSLAVTSSLFRRFYRCLGADILKRAHAQQTKSYVSTPSRINRHPGQQNAAVQSPDTKLYKLVQDPFSCRLMVEEKRD